MASLTHGQLKSGNYYLKESMTISGKNAVELNGEDITLCLNGSTLTPVSGKRAFTLIGEKESKLTVTSCSDGGTIIGGIAEGGAVRVGNNGGDVLG